MGSSVSTNSSMHTGQSCTKPWRPLLSILTWPWGTLRRHDGQRILAVACSSLVIRSRCIVDALFLGAMAFCVCDVVVVVVAETEATTTAWFTALLLLLLLLLFSLSLSLSSSSSSSSLGYEVIACIILSVLYNRLWDAYDDQSALQMARAKQMMLLAMVWWALLVVLSGATVFGDNFDRGVKNLADIAVIPILTIS